MSDMQDIAYKVCPGAGQRAVDEHECGRDFWSCPVCERLVSTQIECIHGQSISFCQPHPAAAIRYCGCGNGVWDENDYLCDECRKATLQIGLRDGHAA